MSDPTVSAEALAPATVDHPDTMEAPVAPTPGADKEKPRSLRGDAWRDLRRRPAFVIACVLIIVLVVMAFWPSLFTDTDPNDGDLALSRDKPSSEAWFGYDTLGRDVYARTIYGARASIAVGVFATILVTLIGISLGMLAGFFGGVTDSLLSRLTDIFFAIPLLLGAIIILVSFPNGAGTNEAEGIAKVTLALAVLGWPVMTRIMRSSVIQVKHADYVQAARALGGSNSRIMRKHVLTNSLSPVIIVAMISLGGYIGAEATLSFLGLGLPPSVISWGGAISDAENYIRQSPHMIFFPGIFLSVTVLAFILLGDTVRDALDPKLR